MRWFKFFVFVIYCVLVYLVAYVFPHEKKLPDFYQSQFLSIGSITVVVIVVVAIVVWEHRGSRGRSCTSLSYKKKK